MRIMLIIIKVSFNNVTPKTVINDDNNSTSDNNDNNSYYKKIEPNNGDGFDNYPAPIISEYL